MLYDSRSLCAAHCVETSMLCVRDLPDPSSHDRSNDILDATQDFYDGSPGRYQALAILASAVFLCAGAWNTLAAVFQVAEERFDVGPGGVNWISMSTFITYVPGAPASGPTSFSSSRCCARFDEPQPSARRPTHRTPPPFIAGTFIALWVIDRWGLRAVLLWGIASQVAMNVIKTFACAAPFLSPRGAYAVLMVGQVLGGTGQPLILNVITRFTMDWCGRNDTRPRSPARPAPKPAALQRRLVAPCAPAAAQVPKRRARHRDGSSLSGARWACSLPLRYWFR